MGVEWAAGVDSVAGVKVFVLAAAGGFVLTGELFFIIEFGKASSVISLRILPSISPETFLVELLSSASLNIGLLDAILSGAPCQLRREINDNEILPARF